MDDFERRRIQNREAQRRFRQRHNQRKAANQAVQTFTSEVTIDQPSRRESSATSNSPSLDKLVDPSNTAGTTTSSLFTTAFDYGMGIYSSTLLDGIDFMHDQDPTFSTSSSSLLQVSPADTSSDPNTGQILDPNTGQILDPNTGQILDPNADQILDPNTDQILGALIASTHNSGSSATTRSKSVDGNGCSPGGEKGSSARECVSLITTGGNGATSASSETEKPDGGWQNPLHIAAAKGHDRIARILLQHNIDCNEKDSDGLTPLIHATIGGYEDVVGSLLSHGASIAIVDSQYHRSALHWAIVHRRESLLNILLDRCMAQQTVIDIYDKAGRTPLHTAVDTGYDAGVQLLLQFGANAQYKTRKRKASF